MMERRMIGIGMRGRMLAAAAALAGALGGCAGSLIASAPPVSAAGSAPPVAPADSGPVTSQVVARGNAEFGIDLYRRLANAEGNLFVSPVSIAGAFGPVVAGARGETAQAIARTMRFPTGGPALHPVLGGLLRELERREGATVSIANALWVRRDFPPKVEFVRTARADYDARVEALDFVGAPVAAAARINAWVAGETRGRIPTLIKAESLDDATLLVVTNAVYFLGDWAVPFNADNTTPQPFWMNGRTSRAVPLMYRKGAFRYWGGKDGDAGAFQAIDLPYKDPRLSMSVFLPAKRDGLAELERGLTGPALARWLARLDAAPERTVRLYLPKTRIEATYQLGEPLKAMGMEIAFGGQADFRGVADADLAIGSVVHKSFLRIDEKGTEAAAATGVEIVVTSATIPPPPEFRADHPFFLVIRDKQSGAVLFAGRIAAPEPA